MVVIRTQPIANPGWGGLVVYIGAGSPMQFAHRASRSKTQFLRIKFIFSAK